MCIDGIADPGDNILIPQPGFSLYVTLCQSLGIEARFYDLLVTNLSEYVEKKTEFDLIFDFN